MEILTIKRLPQTEEELTLLKELFGESIIINLYDEEGNEPIGFRKATDLEVKFLNELKEVLERRN